MSAATTSNELAKLKIESYTDIKLNDNKIEFSCYYNPSSFTTTYAIEYDEAVPFGDPKYEMKTKKYAPLTYSFELMFDGTGASVPSGIAEADKVLDVDKKIADFIKATGDYEGTAHRTRYLKLTWGNTLYAQAVLTGLVVTKDLFSSTGKTLRAKLACSFKEFRDSEQAKAEMKKSSPDMTHERTVQQGDRLPLMCERIYGDSRLYLQVARFNNLKDYRNLQPGQKLYFPPLITPKG